MHCPYNIIIVITNYSYKQVHFFASTVVSGSCVIGSSQNPVIVITVVGPDFFFRQIEAFLSTEVIKLRVIKLPAENLYYSVGIFSLRICMRDFKFLGQ